MTVHLTISGKVQGVFFRASARDMALTLEIRGWVKNTSEGNVEILANGNDISIMQFIAWCRKCNGRSCCNNRSRGKRI